MSSRQARKESMTVSGARILVFLCVIPLLLIGASRHSHASEVANYPTRPVTFIIPLPPGGASELATRLILKHTEKYLGQPIIPVNKP